MDCLVNGTDTALSPCEHDPGRPVTLALLGDSHAASLWEAVTAVADQEGWSARLDAHSGCPPFADASFTGPTMPADQPPACARWSADAVAALAADPTVQDVLVSYRSDIYKHVAPDGELEDAFPADTIRSALQPLVDAGKRVHVVRAVPTTNGVSARTCSPTWGCPPPTASPRRKPPRTPAPARATSAWSRTTWPRPSRACPAPTWST